MSAQSRAQGLFPTFKRRFPEMFDFDRFFESPFQLESWKPAMNVKDQDDHYQIEFAVPGFKKDDFDITVKNGILIVSYEQKDEMKEEEEGYTRREFNYTSFQRSLTLPPDADETHISAKYTDGILKIDLDKKHGTVSNEGRKIQID